MQFESGKNISAHQQVNDVLTPIYSGKVTEEAAVRLPRQKSTQTREDMLEAGERLASAYILYGPEPLGMSNPIDPFDLLPAVTVEGVVMQASEIARQRLVNAEEMLPHERVAPLTIGAFYKSLAEDYVARNGSRKHAIGAFKWLVAARLIDGFKPGDPFVGSIAAMEQGEDFRSSVRLGFEAECERRLYDPSYIFLGAVAALEGRNPTLQPYIQAAGARELAATNASLRHVLTMSGREVWRNLSIEHFSSVLVGLMRGSVGRVRRAIASESGGVNPERWHPAGLGALAIFESFTTERNPVT